MCPVNSVLDSRSQKARAESDGQSHSVRVSPPVETRRKRAQQGRAPPPGGLRLGGENGAPGSRSTRAASGPLRFKSRGAWEGRGQSRVWGDVAKTPFPYFPAWPDAWARCRAPRKPRSSSGAPPKNAPTRSVPGLGFTNRGSEERKPPNRPRGRTSRERTTCKHGRLRVDGLAGAGQAQDVGRQTRALPRGPAPHKTAAHDFHGPPTNHEHAVQGWKQ